MSDLIWLSEAQMRRIEPYFPFPLWRRLADCGQTASGRPTWESGHW